MDLLTLLGIRTESWSRYPGTCLSLNGYTDVKVINWAECTNNTPIPGSSPDTSRLISARSLESPRATELADPIADRPEIYASKTPIAESCIVNEDCMSSSNPICTFTNKEETVIPSLLELLNSVINCAHAW